VVVLRLLIFESLGNPAKRRGMSDDGFFGPMAKTEAAPYDKLPHPAPGKHPDA
jgi:hypothetical protein